MNGVQPIARAEDLAHRDAVVSDPLLGHRGRVADGAGHGVALRHCLVLIRGETPR